MQMNLEDIFTQYEKWRKHQNNLAEYRKLSTEQLKTLWDSFDGDAGLDEPGCFWPTTGPHIEDVHMLLNERGEGAYCAV